MIQRISSGIKTGLYAAHVLETCSTLPNVAPYGLVSMIERRSREEDFGGPRGGTRLLIGAGIGGLLPV